LAEIVAEGLRTLHVCRCTWWWWW